MVPKKFAFVEDSYNNGKKSYNQQIIIEKCHRAMLMAWEKSKHLESTHPSKTLVDLLCKRHCLLGTKDYKTELVIFLVFNEFPISCSGN